MDNNYAEIIVDIQTRKLDKTFTYKIPDAFLGRIFLGSRVMVDFNKNKHEGYVVSFAEKPEYETKDIISILPEELTLNRDLLLLSQWMRDYYMCSWIESLQTILPGPVRYFFKGVNYKKKLEIAEFSESKIKSTPFELSVDQSQIIRNICEKMEKERPEVILVHGVTGSGKTEIYLESIRYALKLGKGAIVLVPEISLTPQAISRYRNRFGDLVSVMHSNLSNIDRAISWWNIKRGYSKVVLGVRSAIFAPMENIGIIIIDEEHESSYKQENSPRYHAKAVAIQRAKSHGAVVLLGSATPSIEAFYWAQKDNYKYYFMKDRITKHQLPAVTIVDMKEILKNSPKNKVFSPVLLEKIEQRLKVNQQTILFLNRRGFSSLIICEDCGKSIICPHCSISLTFHKHTSDLRCHYCFYKTTPTDKCQFCGGYKLKPIGMGTQAVEEQLQSSFPNINFARMDSDTTKQRGSFSNILKMFENREIQVLLGTQMIAKGLDYPNVTLVGVINADTALNMPDFRAQERTFQLITQVAGRAGRGDFPGEVIVQTYNPENYCIINATKQDYFSFYQTEIVEREGLFYPPFGSIINVIVFGKTEEIVIEDAIKLENEIRGLFKNIKNEYYEILGPAPCPISKIRGKYRWHVIIKIKGDKKGILDICQILKKRINLKDVSLAIDVDPLSLL